MNKLVTQLLICFTLTAAFTFAGEIRLKGIYKGKNLYVQNPFSGENEFCTQKVYLNGIQVLEYVNQSAYEIDLSALGMNEDVQVIIYHKDGCTPKILNEQVIRPTSTFKYESFHVDHHNVYWGTRGERPGGKFYVEQFKYNNWVTAVEVNAKGTLAPNHYSIKEPHHSGTNKYRIKYVDAEDQVYYTKQFEHQSKKDMVTFYPKKATNTLYLSRSTDYEVTDKKGISLIKGTGKEISVQTLESGHYFLNLDNRTEKFKKK